MVLNLTLGRNFLTTQEMCNINVIWRNHCCCGTAVSIKYSECMPVASVIQHAKRMRRIMLSSVACPAVEYFSTLSRKWRIFEEKKNY
jgi:hypothetical protein